MTDKDMRNMIHTYKDGIELLWGWDSGTLGELCSSATREVEQAPTYNDVMDLVAAMRAVGIGITGNFGWARMSGAVLAGVMGSCGWWEDEDNVVQAAMRLMIRMVRRHPFTDGNNRIAYVTALWFMTKNGVHIPPHVACHVLTPLILMAAATDMDEAEIIGLGLVMLDGSV